MWQKKFTWTRYRYRCCSKESSCVQTQKEVFTPSAQPEGEERSCTWNSSFTQPSDGSCRPYRCIAAEMSSKSPFCSQSAAQTFVWSPAAHHVTVRRRFLPPVQLSAAFSPTELLVLTSPSPASVWTTENKGQGRRRECFCLTHQLATVGHKTRSTTDSLQIIYSVLQFHMETIDIIYYFNLFSYYYRFKPLCSFTFGLFIFVAQSNWITCEFIFHSLSALDFLLLT